MTGTSEVLVCYIEYAEDGRMDATNPTESLIMWISKYQSKYYK